MRVLVCGGRDYRDVETLDKTLDQIHAGSPVKLLIHGGAQGADAMAQRWAKELRVKVHAEPARWRQFGKAAGPIRNRKMLEQNPDLLVAFPGGKGTADMVRQVERMGIPVLRV